MTGGVSTVASERRMSNAGVRTQDAKNIVRSGLSAEKRSAAGSNDSAPGAPGRTRFA